MKLRTILSATALLTLMSMGFGSPAFSQSVTCSNIDSSSSDFPSGVYSQGCGVLGVLPSDSQDMLETLQGMAFSTLDASMRLQGFAVTPGDTVTVTVTDSSLPAPVSVNYTVGANDQFADVATGLAAAIQGNASLQSAGLSASSYAAGVEVYSNPANTTTYSFSTSSGATESLSQYNYSASDVLIIVGGSIQHPTNVYYLFNDAGDYSNATVPTPHFAVDPNHAGDTFINPDTLAPYGFTVILQSTGTTPTPVYNTPNTTAHETGHVLDSLYGNSLVPVDAKGLILRGTPQLGDRLTVTFSNSNLPGGFESVDYTVGAGDTMLSIAEGLSAAINTNSDLLAAGFNATVEDLNPAYNILVDSTGGGSTSVLTSVSSGSTETLTTVNDSLVSNSKAFLDALAVDFKAMNALPACSYYPFGTTYPSAYSPGLFSDKKDPLGNYFCDHNSDPLVPDSPGNGEHLQGSYAGMTTRQALEEAYPEFFNPTDEKVERREIFAEEIGPAVFNYLDLYYYEGPNANTANPAAIDSYFSYNGGLPYSFLCTKHVTNTLATTGKLPTDMDQIHYDRYINDDGTVKTYYCDGSEATTHP